MRRARIGAALAFAGVAALVGLYLRRREPALAPPDASAPAPAARCHFAAGDVWSYQLSSSAEETAGEDSAQESLRAKVWFRVEREVSPTEWRVAVAMSDVVHDGVLRELDAPTAKAMVVRVNQACAFAGFGFDKSVPVDARRYLRGQLRDLEIVLAGGPGAYVWVSRQSDELGEYAATYRVAAPDVTPLELTKQRNRYLQVDGPMGSNLKTTIVESQTRATVDPGGRWMQRIDGVEHLTLRFQGKVLADVRATTHLSPRADDAPFPRPVPADGDLVWEDPKTDAGVAAAAPEPATIAMSVDDATAKFVALATAGDTASSQESLALLIAYLRAHPDAADEVVARIRRGAIPPAAQSTAFLALEKAGTPRAQEALRGALKDGKLDGTNRMRAALALADVPSPSKDTFEALRDAARSPAGSQSNDLLRGTATRALGRLQKNVGRSQPELAASIREELERELRDARSPDAVGSALDAMGNSGDATAYEEAVARKLEDESPLLRAQAARTLGKLGGAAATKALVDRFGREPDPLVREMIADALIPDDAPPLDFAVAMAAAAVASEPDVNVRGALLRLLGEASKGDASAKVALVTQFRREQVASLKALIGRYCTAAELR